MPAHLPYDYFHTYLSPYFFATLIENLPPYPYQDKQHLSNEFSTQAEKLYILENDKKILSIISKFDHDSGNQNQISDWLVMNDVLDNLYASNYSMLDSIFVYFNNGRFLVHKGKMQNEKIIFDFNSWQSKYTGNKLGYYWLRVFREIIEGIKA